MNSVYSHQSSFNQLQFIRRVITTSLRPPQNTHESSLPLYGYENNLYIYLLPRLRAIPWQNNGPRILLSLSLSLPYPFLALFIDHPPRRITVDTLRSDPWKEARSSGRNGVLASQNTLGPSKSPPSSLRAFTRTFHVCWLRVEAWIISAHAQWRASRRRVKTIPTVALRSVRRGTWSRTVPLASLDITPLFPRVRRSTKSFFVDQVCFFEIDFVFWFRIFLIRDIGGIVYLGIA